MISPLELVGRIPVPRAARQHRFYREAFLVARALDERDPMKEGRVIGTENSQQCELYGWGANIASHVDNSGFVYLCLMSAAESLVMVEPSKDDPQEHAILMRRGDVLRLNDFRRHFTYEGEGSRVGAFVGSFDAPEDERAMGVLRRGILSLAQGHYYGAPRVRDGFRILMDDECFVMGKEEWPELMLLADATARGKTVVTCAECEAPAHYIDKMWPYQWEQNYCAAHREAAKQKRAA